MKLNLKSKKIIGSTIVFTLVLIVLFPYLKISFDYVRTYFFSKETEGIIFSTDLYETSYGKFGHKHLYYPRILYTYEINGLTYKNLDYIGFFGTDKKDALKEIENYKVGSKKIVYYSEKKPQKSSLEKFTNEKLFLFVKYVFILCSVIFLISFIIDFLIKKFVGKERLEEFRSKFKKDKS